MNVAFDADQWDVLQELVNQGMGAAGASLAAAFDSFVALEVPRLALVEGERLGDLAGRWRACEFSAVRQVFFGGLSGETLMLFQGLDGPRIAALLGYDHACAAEGDEATLDLANAVMGACLCGIADPLGEGLSFSPPALVAPRPELGQLLELELAAGQQVLLIDIDLRLEDRRLESRVLIFMSDLTLRRVGLAVTRFLEALA